MTLPHQNAVRKGLEREDLFTVFFDSFMTDTARYADVILPATTFFERREIRRSYGTYALQEAEGVIDPVCESRTNHDVFLELCDRMELSREGDARTLTEVRDKLLETTGEGPRLIQALNDAGS